MSLLQQPDPQAAPLQLDASEQDCRCAGRGSPACDPTAATPAEGMLLGVLLAGLPAQAGLSPYLHGASTPDDRPCEA